MYSERERLTDLIVKAAWNGNSEFYRISEGVADSLCTSGVIVPPAPIGTTIYMVITKRPKMYFPEFSFVKTSYITWNNLARVIRDFGKDVFLKREDAERELKRRDGENERDPGYASQNGGAE